MISRLLAAQRQRARRHGGRDHISLESVRPETSPGWNFSGWLLEFILLVPLYTRNHDRRINDLQLRCVDRCDPPVVVGLRRFPGHALLANHRLWLLSCVCLAYFRSSVSTQNARRGLLVFFLFVNLIVAGTWGWVLGLVLGVHLDYWSTNDAWRAWGELWHVSAWQ
jgi:hypothetical protein